MKKLAGSLLERNINAAAEYDLKNHKGFGCAYYVYQEDHLEAEFCFGTTSLNGSEKVSADTGFRLASMTKPVTSVAAAVLMSRGLLSLSDPVEKFLPEFKDVRIKSALGADLGAPVQKPTVLNLLTHTSGIGSSAEKDAVITEQDKITRDAYVRRMLEAGLDFEPGSAQQYSGLAAFDVLSQIIENISGEDLEAFFRKEIFEPCGMTNTTFLPDAARRSRMIRMHMRSGNENAERTMPEGCIFEDYPENHFLGGAGLVSTLSDYARFARMLLNNGRINGVQIGRADVFALMRNPSVSPEVMPGFERWGLGVRVITDSRYPYLPVGTFGWSGAYGTHFWVDPANRITAVYMKNSGFDGGAANESARYFEKTVYSSF